MNINNNQIEVFTLIWQKANELRSLLDDNVGEKVENFVHKISGRS